MVNILTGIAVAAIVALAGFLWSAIEKARDKRAVWRWLSANTVDEPGKSHAEVIEIIKGTRLSDARVFRALNGHPKIFLSDDKPCSWSVWRKNPQSVYEKRGVRTIG